MSDFFTGLDAVPGASQRTDIFNKTAINADNLYARVRHYGAWIESAYQPDPARTFNKGEFAIIPNDSVVYDTDRFFNPAIPGRLSVPENVDLVEVWAFLRFPVGNWGLSIFQTGNSGETVSFQTGFTSVTNKYCYATVKTGIISVSTGNYFEAYVSQLSTGVETFDQQFKSGHDGSLVTEVATPTASFLSVRAYKI